MAIDDYLEPEVGVAVAVSAVIFSPPVRRVARRGAVYGLAGIMMAGDALASLAGGIGRGVRQVAPAMAVGGASSAEPMAGAASAPPEASAAGTQATPPETSAAGTQATPPETPTTGMHATLQETRATGKQATPPEAGTAASPPGKADVGTKGKVGAKESGKEPDHD